MAINWDKVTCEEVDPDKPLFASLEDMILWQHQRPLTDQEARDLDTYFAGVAAIHRRNA